MSLNACILGVKKSLGRLISGLSLGPQGVELQTGDSGNMCCTDKCEKSGMPLREAACLRDVVSFELSACPQEWVEQGEKICGEIKKPRKGKGWF